jgi:hypothetical protein
VSDGRRTALRVGAGSVAVVVVLLLGGYAFGWGWTGYRNQTGEVNKLWDWLTLLLQPLTLALLPLWLRSGARRRRDWLVLGTAAAVVFLVLVVGGYRLGWSWTGFAGNTLWDWLKLFLVPFLLPLVLLLMVPAEEDHTVLVPPTPAPHRRADPPSRHSWPLSQQRSWPGCSSRLASVLVGGPARRTQPTARVAPGRRRSCSG